ncbi:serine protease persephone-like [Ostrinia nubilalis]|uniref:serine protease persephone-like n=1 Tax=Ostrinia furnacalis TaxID=93504 RepID=UPI00103A4FFA|nr:serine protease persephone-like [Ostrinia furnacalis]
MCCKQFLVISFAIILKNIAAQDVGDECVPNNEVFDGVCTVITECEVALRAIQKRNFHNYQRCGFSGSNEVVCCPRTTEKFGATNDNRGGNNSQRKAERECKKIIETSRPPLDLHIIGGEKATLGEFPHMVAIGYDRGNGYQFDCGGALISDTYVLTAAHCIINLERVEPQMIRAGVIVLGDNTWNENSDYRVARSITHPNYTHSSKYHDIALLRLANPVEVSENLHAACLYTSASDPLGPLTITGWGRISTTQSLTSNVLLKTKVNPVTRERCTPEYPGWRKLPNGIIEGQLCAGDPQGGHDACQGDSGGPLQISESDVTYRLVGVTSFGKGCGTTTPGVYTRVAHYIDWIENIVWPN